MEFEKYMMDSYNEIIDWEWRYGIFDVVYTGENIETVIEKEYLRKYNDNKFIILEHNPDKVTSRKQLLCKHIEPKYVFRIYEDATNFFKKLIKEKDIVPYKDLKDLLDSNRAKEISTDLKEFIDSIGSYHRRSFKIKSTEKNHFVYFLKDQGEIVYVGQSTSFSYQRPLQHTDKKYDEFEILEIPHHLNLNAIEALLIFKHKPKYNKGMPVASNVISKAIECLMDC